MKTAGRCSSALLVAGVLAAMPVSVPAVHVVQPEEQPLALTERERAWIDEHPIIRASNDPGWAPIDFDGPEGLPAGIAAEIMELVAQRLDLNIEYVPEQTWVEAYDAARERRVDLLLALARSPQRERSFLFTAPYMTYRSVIVVRQDMPFVADISELLNRRFAAVTGYHETERLRARHPELDIIEFPTVEEALEAVAVARADAVVGNIAVLDHKLRELGLTNLKVAATTDEEEVQLQFAVRADWPELVGILNKGLAGISAAERQAILDKWVNVTYDRGLDPAKVWRRAAEAIAGAVLLLALVWLYLRRLRREIEDRKRAEARVEAAQRQLQEITDTVPANVFQLRGTQPGDAAFTFMNAPMGAFLRAERTAGHAAFRHALGLIVEEDRPRLVEAVRRSGEAMLPVEIEFRARRADGTIAWLHCGAVPRRLASGELAWNGYTIDVTERKRLEQELAKAKEVAESASRAKSDFLANMSHEIRTPMNAIIGLSHLMQKTRLEPRQLDYLSKISGAAQSLLRIINDVLDFSKVEAGQLTLEAIRFDLYTVFDDLVGILGHRASEKGLALRMDIAPELPQYLVGDPLRLSQILVNLTGNAVKFTQRGYVAVSAQRLDETGDRLRVRFAVQDTGIGLTREQIGRLFKSFQQADSTTTRQFGGTGLGLSISKRLVELMGGEIGVDSVPGQGSTFWFTAALRRAEDQSDAALPMAKSGPPAHLRGARVLLVEDNAINQQVASELLQEAGMIVDIAGNGLEAIRAIRARAYDAVLMDVQMPVMDGLQATEAIRALPEFTSLPIIAMTASVMRGDREGCLRAGMNDYISKPINVDKMLATLARWIPERVRAVPPAADGEAAPADRTDASVLPIGLDGFDVAEGVKRMGGDRDLYLRLLLQFREHSASAGDEIRGALAKGDRASAKSLAHMLKGVAGNLSAMDLFRAAERLERALRKGVDPAGDEVEALAAEHARAMRSLAPLQSAPAPGTAGGQPLSDLMRTLDERLSGQDAGARDALAAVKGALDGDHEPFVAELETHIANYNFEEARSTLARLEARLKSPGAE